MNCEPFKNNIVLYAAGELPESAARELLLHAASCAECAEELKSFKAVLRDIPPTQAPPRDFAMLYGKALLTRDARLRRKSFVFKIAALSSAAAVLLVCVALFFAIRHTGPASPDNKNRTEPAGSLSLWNDKSDAELESLKTGLDELSASFSTETDDEIPADDKLDGMSDNIALAKYNFENPEPSFYDSYYDYTVNEMKTNMDSLYYDLTEF